MLFAVGSNNGISFKSIEAKWGLGAKFINGKMRTIQVINASIKRYDPAKRIVIIEFTFDE